MRTCESEVDDPAKARILIAITFYYRAERLQFLCQVLQGLAEFPVELMKVVIITNANDREVLSIRRLCDILLAKEKAYELEPVPSELLERNKFAMTWHHKTLIINPFLEGVEKWTHFICLEDDIKISFRNFCYFMRYRGPLGKHGVIPSFIRVEYNYRDNFLYLVDQVRSTLLEGRPFVRFGDIEFRTVDGPFSAMYMLDRELAAEYAASPAFDISRSESVSGGWGVPERAAMGLCFTNIPQGYRCRVVVPRHVSGMMPDPMSWVFHLPNKYTNELNKAGFGTVRLDQAFE
jgi:hypothetical protein